MEIPINDKSPLTMHIDLNSCFAIIEQQANPLIRRRPVAISAYDSPGGIVIASSYEAKKLGIKLGVTVRQAKQLCPSVIILTPDPNKYLDAHKKFKKVLLKYTDNITPKSIDEFVVNFKDSLITVQSEHLEEIGRRIKQDIKNSLGEYVTVNIGIGPNRFLAKLAAGLHKPDGLDVINHENLREIYSKLSLLDFPGINKKYKARLNIAGIYSPLEFLESDVNILKKQVFMGINGYHWYMRLRGHEVDDYNSERKSFGHQYALSQKSNDKEYLYSLLMKLSEKTGRRLRNNNFCAGNVSLFLRLEDKTTFNKTGATNIPIYSTQDIFSHAKLILDKINLDSRVALISLVVSNLVPADPAQVCLFHDTKIDSRPLAQASDVINNKYGEFTLMPARMLGLDDKVIKRIGFGGV
jgi:DNA polymerase-4